MPEKIILITGNELRHRYLAHECAVHFDLAKVYFEQKANVHEKFDLPADEKTIMDEHFRQRNKSEEKYFKSYENIDRLKYSFISTGESNSGNGIGRDKKYISGLYYPFWIKPYKRSIVIGVSGQDHQYSSRPVSLLSWLGNKFLAIGS